MLAKRITPGGNMNVEIGDTSYTQAQIKDALQVLKKMQDDNAHFHKKENVAAYKDKFNQKAKLLKYFTSL